MEIQQDYEEQVQYNIWPIKWTQDPYSVSPMSGIDIRLLTSEYQESGKFEYCSSGIGNITTGNNSYPRSKIINKTLYWYIKTNSTDQFNFNQRKYFWVAFG